jgi:hypothetical protein
MTMPLIDRVPEMPPALVTLILRARHGGRGHPDDGDRPWHDAFTAVPPGQQAIALLSLAGHLFRTLPQDGSAAIPLVLMQAAAQYELSDPDWPWTEADIERIVRQARARFTQQSTDDAPPEDQKRPSARPIASPEPDPWPDPLDDAAYSGLAGELVRLVEPQSEADAVALLVHPLILIGTLAGRGPHITIAADRHGLNEFALFVGDTSKARKGVSAGYTKRLGAELDPIWRQENLQGGLSTGEGLIDCVRDPVEKLQTVKERGQPPREELVVTDPGVSDKRALILESEFSKVLRVMRRPESTLSATLRQAWDGDPVLLVRARTNRLRATGAHVSLIGHIVRGELLRHVDNTEAAGGGLNRFLLFCIQRSKELPFGGRVSSEAFDAIADRFRTVVKYSCSLTAPFTWSGEAAEQWVAVYSALSAAKPGLFGAVVARGEAHVLRLTCLYALLDQSLDLRPEHLKAALALWQYAEDSAQVIFGEALGDPTADTIYHALRRSPDGLTRTMISGLFGRNLSAAEIDRALGVLLKHGRAVCRSETTEGRSVERWFACTHGRTK